MINELILFALNQKQYTIRLTQINKFISFEDSPFLWLSIAKISVSIKNIPSKNAAKQITMFFIIKYDHLIFPPVAEYII